MYNYGNFVNPGYSDYTPDLRQRLNNMQMQQNMRQQPMPQPYVQPYTPPQPVQQPANVFGSDTSTYAKVCKAWFEDIDVAEGKAYRYYMNVAKPK